MKATLVPPDDVRRAPPQSENWHAASAAGASLKAGAGSIHETPSKGALAGGLFYGSSPAGAVGDARPAGTIIPAPDVEFFGQGDGREELNGLQDVSKSLPPEAAAKLAAAIFTGVKPDQLAVNLVSLVKAPGCAPEFLTDGLRQLANTKRLGDLQHAIERLPPEDAPIVGKALADAFVLMRLPKSTRDGMVLIGDAILAGLHAHRGGKYGAEIAGAMGRIDKRILEIPADAGETQLLRGFQGVTNEKLAMPARVANLANLVRSVAPERLARMLQRLKPDEIGGLENVFKEVKEVKDSAVAKNVADAIGKMRASDTRGNLVDTFGFGFEEQAANSKAFADILTQVKRYQASDTQILYERMLKEVVNRDLDESTRAAYLAKMAGVAELPGVIQLLDGSQRNTLLRAFARLDPKVAPILAGAIATAIDKMDGADGISFARASMDAFYYFKGNHSDMSSGDSGIISDAHHQVYGRLEALRAIEAKQRGANFDSDKAP